MALGGAAYMAQAADEPDAATEYAKYENTRWHFSLAVPTDMTVSKFDREGGGQTVQFIDATGDKEFMISAWPYTELDVTLGSIAEPRGISDQPDHLEIVEVLRDDTFRVLFAKNGVLYSVVTLPEHEAWLTDILTSWEFVE